MNRTPLPPLPIFHNNHKRTFFLSGWRDVTVRYGTIQPRHNPETNNFLLSHNQIRFWIHSSGDMEIVPFVGRVRIVSIGSIHLHTKQPHTKTRFIRSKKKRSEAIHHLIYDCSCSCSSSHSCWILEKKRIESNRMRRKKDREKSEKEDFYSLRFLLLRIVDTHDTQNKQNRTEPTRSGAERERRRETFSLSLFFIGNSTHPQSKYTELGAISLSLSLSLSLSYDDNNKYCSVHVHIHCQLNVRPACIIWGVSQSTEKEL